jgi:hypothetical protein
MNIDKKKKEKSKRTRRESEGNQRPGVRRSGAR